MSLESALRIFKEQGFKDAKWAVDTIQRAKSLDELKQIMIDEGTTSLSASQFVSFRICSIYKDDPDFARKTSEDAKVTFSKYGLPENIVEDYISNGGGEDIALTTSWGIELGKFGEVDIDKIETNLKEFYRSANEYLFKVLRSYVIDSPS